MYLTSAMLSKAARPHFRPLPGIQSGIYRSLSEALKFPGATLDSTEFLLLLISAGLL